MAKDVQKRGEDEPVDATYREIREILETARSRACRAVNTVMVQAYWEIGRLIVEEEQKGEKRAGYGKELIEGLAKRLRERYGQGFSVTNL